MVNNIYNKIKKNLWVLEQDKHDFKLRGRKLLDNGNPSILGLGRIFTIRRYGNVKLDEEIHIDGQNSVFHLGDKRLEEDGFEKVKVINKYGYSLELFVDIFNKVLIRGFKDDKPMGVLEIVSPQPIYQERAKDIYQGIVEDVVVEGEIMELKIKTKNSVGKDTYYYYKMIRPWEVVNISFELNSLAWKYRGVEFETNEFRRNGRVKGFNKEINKLCKQKGQLQLTHILVQDLNFTRKNILELYTLNKDNFIKKVKGILIGAKVAFRTRIDKQLDFFVPLGYGLDEETLMKEGIYSLKGDKGFKIFYNTMADYLLYELMDEKMSDYYEMIARINRDYQNFEFKELRKYNRKETERLHSGWEEWRKNKARKSKKVKVGGGNKNGKKKTDH